MLSGRGQDAEGCVTGPLQSHEIIVQVLLYCLALLVACEVFYACFPLNSHLFLYRISYDAIYIRPTSVSYKDDEGA